MAKKNIILILFIISICSISNTAFAQRRETKMSNPIVVLETNQGTIQLELFPDVAPKTVENMVGLVEKGYYDGTIFHRVKDDFMIQGGDPTGTGRGGQSLWGKPFKDEFTPENKFDEKGLLAMANAGANTNGSQFFITVELTPWLNGKHTIFGKVIEGYAVVEKIANTPRDEKYRPLEDQIIIRAYMLDLL